MHCLNKILVGIIAALSLVGFSVSSFLTKQHFDNSALDCSVTKGCEKVLSSNFATIFNVPVALLGVLFYLLLLIVSIHFLLNSINKKILLLICLAGFVFTVYLLFLQAFVLKAWCQYCLVADICAVVIFFLSIVIYINKDEKDGKKS